MNTSVMQAKVMANTKTTSGQRLSARSSVVSQRVVARANGSKVVMASDYAEELKKKRNQKGRWKGKGTATVFGREAHANGRSGKKRRRTRSRSGAWTCSRGNQTHVEPSARKRGTEAVEDGLRSRGILFGVLQRRGKEVQARHQISAW